MLLQNDKPTLTLSRERATRILFDNEPMVAAFPGVNNREVAVNLPETNQIFNNNHNLAEYNKLVETEYADRISLPSMPQDATAPKFEQYYTDANPLPIYHPYKPKPLADFEEISKTANTPVDEALMQKLYETEIHEANATADLAAQSSVTEDSTEPYVRLNTKGLIACVSFIAVTALIIALVILNSIAIGNTGMEISQVKAENATLATECNSAMTVRQDAYQIAYDEAAVIAAAEGGVAPEYISLPRINDHENPRNTDYNTNLFDQICKFITSLFG